MKRVPVTFIAILAAILLIPSLAAQTAAKPIELELVYNRPEYGDAFTVLLETFRKKEPGIRISLLPDPGQSGQILQVLGSQGKLPDIVQVYASGIDDFAAKGWLLDLTKEAFMKKPIQGSLSGTTWKGKQWALPMDMAGIGIIYNKDIFKKLGIAAPSTYLELRRACDALRESGTTPFAGLLMDSWSSGHFISLIHTALLAEAGIATPDFLAGMAEGKASYGGGIDDDYLFSILDFYRDNLGEGAGRMGWNEQQEAFNSGAAAMMVQGLWSYSYGPKEAGIDCGFIPFPVFEDPAMNKFYADVDTCFAVSSQSSSAKKKAALKFLSWLTTQEAQKVWVNMCRQAPAYPEADVSSLGAPFVDLLKGIKGRGFYPWAFVQYPAEVFNDAVMSGAQYYLWGKLESADVIGRIDRQWRGESLEPLPPLYEPEPEPEYTYEEYGEGPQDGYNEAEALREEIGRLEYQLQLLQEELDRLRSEQDAPFGYDEDEGYR